MSAKGQGKQSRTRRWFRVLRRFVFLLVVLVLGGLVWLNYLGFPGFLQSRILSSLQTGDFDLSAAHMRLEGLSRVVVENLRFQPNISNLLPRVEIEEAQVLLGRSTPGRANFELKGLEIRDGRLEWLLERPGRSSELLLVTNLQSELVFLPNQQWQLTDLRGESAGAKVVIAATLKNPASLKKLGRTEGTPDLPPKWKEQVADILEVIRGFDFGVQPELSLQFAGDAADWKTIRATARFQARQVRTEWGNLDGIELRSRLQPANQAFENLTFVRIVGADSEWFRLDHSELSGRAVLDIDGEQASAATMDLRVAGFDSRWVQLTEGSATFASTQENSIAPYRTTLRASATPVGVLNWRGTNLVIQSEFTHSLPIPSLPRLVSRWVPGSSKQVVADSSSNYLSGDWRIKLDHIRAPNLSADSLQLHGTVDRESFHNRERDSALGIWHWLLPYQASWTASLSNIQSGDIELGSGSAIGNWKAPDLKIPSITAALYGGGFSGEAAVNVVSREATASGEADFDYHKVALLLERPVQRWLAQFSWDTPPWVQGNLKVQLPEWTNTWANFDRKVLPSLEIEGKLKGAGAFRGVPADHAESSFHFKDYTWRLPDLVATRPEGVARLNYTGNVSNQDFVFELHTQIDPACLKPLFPEEQHIFFDMVQFPEPPVVQGTARGNWAADDQLFADLQLALTNFLVKGEKYSDLTTKLRYTNLIIECKEVMAHRGSEIIRAPYLRIDVTNETMFVTNAVSTSDPYVAMKLIGEQVYNAIDPYRFATPPTVRINGIVPLRHPSQSDLHFEVAGENFTFWKFRIPSLVGDVFWKGDYLSFSNVVASFYGGKGTWSGSFVLDAENDADFSFAGRAEDSDLKLLIADLFGTNHMEGIFTADLVITSAKTIDDNTWNGFGSMELRDGFLWNIPVFGVFSPMLENLSPGLGTSRVNAGTADFTITNTVFYSENMEVRAPAFRLRYDGRVDLEGNLQAEVEAMLLRDTWVLGPVFSLALWPVSKAFEAEVSGTVQEPKTKLKYVPRILLAPFRALNALKPAPEVDSEAQDQETQNQRK